MFPPSLCSFKQTQILNKGIFLNFTHRLSFVRLYFLLLFYLFVDLDLYRSSLKISLQTEYGSCVTN